MNSSDYIQEDIRLINLYSQTATTYLNGALKSNVQFNFKNILREEPDIIYSTIGISSAQIPVSYFTVNEYNNILATGLGDITITRGNYNASSLRAELQTRLLAVGITGMVVTINSSTGRLVFTATIPFTFLPSIAMDILGFTNVSISSVANIINAPFLLNLLGIQQLRISSSALACNNSSSTQMGESNLIGVIQSTAAPFGMILYANQTSYSVLRNKNISLIDIQILDEDSNYIDFNNIDWTITLQLTIFRRVPLPSLEKDYIVPLLATLNTIQNTLIGGDPPPPPPQDPLPQDPAPSVADNLANTENQQGQDLLNDDDNSLDIMSYNNTLPS